jgi:hypothetical protein
MDLFTLFGLAALLNAATAFYRGATALGHVLPRAKFKRFALRDEAKRFQAEKASLIQHHGVRGRIKAETVNAPLPAGMLRWREAG